MNLEQEQSYEASQEPDAGKSQFPLRSNGDFPAAPPGDSPSHIGDWTPATELLSRVGHIVTSSEAYRRRKASRRVAPTQFHSGLVDSKIMH